MAILNHHPQGKTHPGPPLGRNKIMGWAKLSGGWIGEGLGEAW